MKHVILGFLWVVLCSSLSLAQAAVVASQPTVVNADENKTLAGKVDSVVLVKTGGSSNAELVIIDDNNQRHSFLVKPTTAIYDEAWRAATLDKITKDEKVKVKYMVDSQGTNEAVSIKPAK